MNFPNNTSETLSPRDSERIQRKLPQLTAILVRIKAAAARGADQKELLGFLDDIDGLEVGIHPPGYENLVPDNFEVLIKDIETAISQMSEALTKESEA